MKINFGDITIITTNFIKSYRTILLLLLERLGVVMMDRECWEVEVGIWNLRRGRFVLSTQQQTLTTATKRRWYHRYSFQTVTVFEHSSLQIIINPTCPLKLTSCDNRTVIDVSLLAMAGHSFRECFLVM